jgi:transcriptional regulator with XRE-family HTH domain
LEHFADNLERLLGLHKVSAKEAASLLGLSQSSFSKWSAGKRSPGFGTALKIGDFFEVSAVKLARSPFAELLANELSSAERFEEVERKIQSRRTGLQAVPSDGPVPIERNRRKTTRSQGG